MLIGEQFVVSNSMHLSCYSHPVSISLFGYTKPSLVIIYASFCGFQKLEFIKTKMTADSVQVIEKPPKELSEKPLYKATIKCPFCDHPTSVFHKISASEYGSWNGFNFERHLMGVHKSTRKANEIKPNEKVTEESLNDGTKDDVPVTHSITSIHLSQNETETNKDKMKENYIVVVVPPVLAINSDEVNVKINDIEDNTTKSKTIVK